MDKARYLLRHRLLLLLCITEVVQHRMFPLMYCIKRTRGVMFHMDTNTNTNTTIITSIINLSINISTIIRYTRNTEVSVGPIV